MKTKYYLFLIALFSILAILITLLKESLELSDWITISATLGAAFAALGTGVIALGVTDKPLRFVKFTVKIEVNAQHITKYNPTDLPNGFKRGSGNNPFYSYQVYFKIKNQSKFTLKRPVITFRLPTDFTHPHKINNNKWIPTYHSNLYNVQIDLRSFQYCFRPFRRKEEKERNSFGRIALIYATIVIGLSCYKYLVFSGRQEISQDLKNSVR